MRKRGVSITLQITIEHYNVIKIMKNSRSEMESSKVYDGGLNGEVWYSNLMPTGSYKPFSIRVYPSIRMKNDPSTKRNIVNTETEKYFPAKTSSVSKHSCLVNPLLSLGIRIQISPL